MLKSIWCVTIIVINVISTELGGVCSNESIIGFMDLDFLANKDPPTTTAQNRDNISVYNYLLWGD